MAVLAAALCRQHKLLRQRSPSPPPPPARTLPPLRARRARGLRRARGRGAGSVPSPGAWPGSRRGSRRRASPARPGPAVGPRTEPGAAPPTLPAHGPQCPGAPNKGTRPLPRRVIPPHGKTRVHPARPQWTSPREGSAALLARPPAAITARWVFVRAAASRPRREPRNAVRLMQLGAESLIPANLEMRVYLLKVIPVSPHPRGAGASPRIFPARRRVRSRGARSRRELRAGTSPGRDAHAAGPQLQRPPSPRCQHCQQLGSRARRQSRGLPPRAPSAPALSIRSKCS